MKTYEIEAVVRVRVTLDDTKFDAEFVDQFNSMIGYMGDLSDKGDLLRAHAINIAELEARGVWRDDRNEGYGNSADLGLNVSESRVDDSYIVSESGVVEGI